MRLLVALAVAVFGLLATCGPTKVIQTGSGSFLYAGTGRPVRVWYWAPPEKTGPVLVVVHGQGRDAEGYRDVWMASARAAGALLVVPEFTVADWPDYATDPAAFSLIEPLVGFVKTDTGNTTAGFRLYGHSAGAQFVHRLLAVTSNTVIRAVAANAGWYTTTEVGVAWPYGLSGADPRPFLAAPLTVLLGELDTNPDDPDLRHTPEADRQGLTRLSRGLYFYAEGGDTASSLAAVFRWSVRVVPDVGHSNRDMVPAASAVLFPELEAP